jgi:hypothetical protein
MVALVLSLRYKPIMKVLIFETADRGFKSHPVHFISLVNYGIKLSSILVNVGQNPEFFSSLASSAMARGFAHIAEPLLIYIAVY